MPESLKWVFCEIGRKFDFPQDNTTLSCRSVKYDAKKPQESTVKSHST